MKMVTITLLCPSCEREQWVRNGHAPNGLLGSRAPRSRNGEKKAAELPPLSETLVDPDTSD
jgi:hypothetical protein